jgi:hypothetical protein
LDNLPKKKTKRKKKPAKKEKIRIKIKTLKIPQWHHLRRIPRWSKFSSPPQMTKKD